MKFFLMGIALVITAVLVSFIKGDWSIFYKMTGLVAGASLVIGVLLSGAFLRGDRVGRNLSESKNDRTNRYSLTNKILLIGLPNLIVLIVFYFGLIF